MKRPGDTEEGPSPRRFSAALCRGFIEACCTRERWWRRRSCFPRLYAAASLKQIHGGSLLSGFVMGFPRLYAAASLKPRAARDLGDGLPGFSAALCRGFIEASCIRGLSSQRITFSAALCRGFIEAPRLARTAASRSRGFPRLYAAASLKRAVRLYVGHAKWRRFPRLYAAASLKHDIQDGTPASA